MTPRSYARIVTTSSMRMRWISRECFEPNALVERLLRDAHLRVELRIVVAAVVVRVPRRVQIARTSTDRRSRDSSRRSRDRTRRPPASRGAAGRSGGRCVIVRARDVRRRYSCRVLRMRDGGRRVVGEQHELAGARSSPSSCFASSRCSARGVRDPSSRAAADTPARNSPCSPLMYDGNSDSAAV